MTTQSPPATREAKRPPERPRRRPLPARPLEVLIVERDVRLADAVAAIIHGRGWRPHVIGRAELADGVPRRLLASARLDAVLVDPVALPPTPADWLANVSAALPGAAVVVYARRTTAEQRIHGLRLGVDHWLTKPVDPEELLATIEAAARALAAADDAMDPIEAGELTIDPLGRTCRVHGRLVRLTVKELGVLEFLAARAGRVVTREQVFARVWGWAMAKDERSVDVYVRNLRRKLGTASPDWSYIHTHKGRGYRFEAVPATARRR